MALYIEESPEDSDFIQSEYCNRPPLLKGIDISGLSQCGIWLLEMVLERKNSTLIPSRYVKYIPNDIAEESKL